MKLSSSANREAPAGWIVSIEILAMFLVLLVELLRVDCGGNRLYFFCVCQII
jgi:hypothetical protein